MKKIFFIIMLFGSIINARQCMADDNIRQQAVIQTNKIDAKCQDQAFDNVADNSATYLNAATQHTKCLREHIEREIELAFMSEDQEKVKKEVQDITLATSSFYGSYFYTNKYCKGHCGTMGNMLIYSEKFSQLRKILEDLIYLNLQKLPY